MTLGRPASRRTRARLAAVAGAAVIALAGCTASSSGPANAGFVSNGKAGIDTAAAGHRGAAPDITGKTIDGKQVSLSDFRGKVVVVNIWGSWCPPCRAEAKGFQKVWTAYQGKGVQFLGINTRDNSVQNAAIFEKNFGITYPSIYDPDGTQVLRFPRGTLNPQDIPSTLVIDREGKIAARSLKALPQEDLEGMLGPVLAEQS
ncbi:TlpA family protein disulfide reductase [Streptomyces sp. NPDC092296]|uniref:TlpA family protein disulfide reductase n=1 Tax=Streptomyces sp. NPDC092296 TaxID=3366012 RepID=UPI003810931B